MQSYGKTPVVVLCGSDLSGVGKELSRQSGDDFDCPLKATSLSDLFRMMTRRSIYLRPNWVLLGYGSSLS